MRKFTPSLVLAAAGLVLSFGTIAPVQAAVSWAFNTGCNPQCNFGTGGKTVSNGGVSVTASAWSATANNDTTFRAANLFQYGSNGLGVVHNTESDGTSDTGQPQHALDNLGRYDAVLFDFGSTSVTLEQVTAGWWTNDSDITLLAYTGSGNAINDLQNFEYNDPDGIANGAAVGWDAVGNYEIGDSGAGGGTNDSEAVNSQEISSSYWLIGAYNPAFGACNTQLCSGPNSAPDYIKISELTGSLGGPPNPPTGVAEPSSLLLFALGMMAPVALRRRRETDTL